MQEDNKATSVVIGMGVFIALIATVIGTMVLGIGSGMICGGIAWVAFLFAVIVQATKAQTSYSEEFSNIRSVRW